MAIHFGLSSPERPGESCWVSHLRLANQPLLLIARQRASPLGFPPGKPRGTYIIDRAYSQRQGDGPQGRAASPSRKRVLGSGVKYPGNPALGTRYAPS